MLCSAEKTIFSMATAAMGSGAHDAVVDLAGDAELLREWQRDGGDAGEHDGHSHQAGQKNGAEAA